MEESFKFCLFSFVFIQMNQFIEEPGRTGRMNRRDLLKFSAAGLLMPNSATAQKKKLTAPGALKKNVLLVPVDLGVFERNFLGTWQQRKSFPTYPTPLVNF